MFQNVSIENTEAEKEEDINRGEPDEEIHDMLDIAGEEKDKINEIENSPGITAVKRTATIVNMSSSFKTYNNDFL